MSEWDLLNVNGSDSRFEQRGIFVLKRLCWKVTSLVFVCVWTAWAANAQTPAAPAQSAGASGRLARQAKDLPKTWVDKDTGHRIYRLSNEPRSGASYFNVNPFSPDGRLMEYMAPDGIHVLDLTTLKSRLLVQNPPLPAAERGSPMASLWPGVHPIVVGHETASVFFTWYDPVAKVNALYKADMYSGRLTRLLTLQPRESILTINADETLGAGTMEEESPPGDGSGGDGGTRRPASRSGITARQSKGEMMERRLAARIPLILYTVDLRPGPENGRQTILLHSTDWINHLLFSPADPNLLMYCHEGIWQKVDRIWTIHTDGTHNMLMHQRTMAMEIAGHEFWGPDGETLWYDWQYPRSQVFYLAGYDLRTGERVAYHMTRDDWSIHFNATADRSFFAGDGGDPGQVAHAKNGEWIELFHAHMIPLDGAINEKGFWQPGIFEAEHLVNMTHHNYRLEPNVHITPDEKMVIFTSNMFGPSYVFGVEVAKATGVAAADVRSTPELAAEFNRVDPTPTNVYSSADEHRRY